MKPVVLPHLRYRRLWFGAGVALAVIVAVLSLMPGRHVPDVNVSDKLKHFAAFVMLAFWFGSILVRRDWPWLVVGLLVFGGLIEQAQDAMPLGRTAEWLDVVADAAGVGAGLLLALTALRGWPGWIERVLGVNTP